MKPHRSLPSFAILLTARSLTAAVAAAEPDDLDDSVAHMTRISVCYSASFSPNGTCIACDADLGGIPQDWTVARRDELAPFGLATHRSTPVPALPADTSGGLRFRGDGGALATLDTPGREDRPMAAEAPVLEVPRTPSALFPVPPDQTPNLRRLLGCHPGLRRRWRRGKRRDRA
jgi:hypothetical protein